MTMSMKKMAEEFDVKPDENTSAKINTGIGRFSYFFCLKPNKDGKYSTCFIFQKADKDKFKRLAQEIVNVTSALHGKNMNKWPKTLKCPIGDGDEDRDGEEFNDSYFFNCRTDRKPGVVDTNLDPVIDSDEAYSGCYGRLSISFYYFDVDGNRGVGCGLNNVQICKLGERIDGISKAEDDFAEFKSDDETDDDIPF